MYHRGEIARVKNFPRVALYIYTEILSISVITIMLLE